MTWRHVLRRDLTSVYRSRLGPAVALLVILFSVGAVSLMAYLAAPGYAPGMDQAVLVLGGAFSFVVPLAGLLGSYAAVVGERTTGSVRFLLGLPNSRGDAYLGKYLSRAVVVLAPLALGTFGAAVVVVSVFDGGSFAAVALLGLVTAALALLFVGLGLTASTLADTDTQAVALAVGAFVAFRAGWPAVQWVGLQSMRDAYPRPDWYFWFGRLNPLNAYVRVTNAFADIEYHPLLTHARDAPAFAVSLEFAVAVLLVWTAAAPVAGFVYFRRRDLL